MLDALLEMERNFSKFRNQQIKDDLEEIGKNLMDARKNFSSIFGG